MKDTKTILIVEDEEKLRTTVADFLKLYNYNVLEAKDGQKAIEMFEENMKDIDLVLLDIMLPVFDGQYVLKKIRDFSEVPIIMMTAKTGDYEQIKSLHNLVVSSLYNLETGKEYIWQFSNPPYVKSDHFITTSS